MRSFTWMGSYSFLAWWCHWKEYCAIIRPGVKTYRNHSQSEKELNTMDYLSFFDNLYCCFNVGCHVTIFIPIPSQKQKNKTKEITNVKFLCRLRRYIKTLETVFHPISKFRQKYSVTRRIFNSVLGVWKSDETLPLLFDILHKHLAWLLAWSLDIKLFFVCSSIVMIH